MNTLYSLVKKPTLWMLFALLSPSASLTAQTAMQVQGTVKDSRGDAIIGANVVVDGTTTGAITDIDGRFTINGVPAGASIKVSYVGYITQTQRAAAVMNFIIVEDAETLNEVVVVGYGTTKRSNISGAVASVKADELPTAASASVGEMLRGRAAGMNITSNSAAPGSTLNIAIRGGLSGQAPLIVVDGIPQAPTSNISSGTIYAGAGKDGGLININPNDIESIDILKDASAAAIYGSDASGGVILITTKRGKVGKPAVSYSGSVALSYIKDAPNFLNAKDFMTVQNQVFDELGRSGEKKFTEQQIADFVGDGTDWMKEVTRTGMVNEHNLSVTAGGESTRALFSVSYYNHQGIAKNNDMERITGRLNLDQDFGKYVKAGINSTFSQINYQDVPLGDSRQQNSALIYSAMTFIPTVPVYDENGNYSDNPIRSNIYPNPVSLLEIDDHTASKDIYMSGYIEVRPLKELLIKATGGVDIKDVQKDQYIPTTTREGFSSNGKASKQNAKSQMNLINVIAQFQKVFAEKHDVSVMAGWEYKKQSWEGMGILATQFPFDNAGVNNMANSAQEKPNISSYKGSSEMASFISRVNYAFNNRYILTANVRVDGSSNFSQKHQWGAFPGVSLAWRMKEESWLRDVDWLYNLKLRGGVGQTGNAGNLTGIYTYYSVMNGAFAPGGTIVNGVAMAKIGNENLKWETLTDYNIGIDFGLFNNRLSGTIDLYQRMRKDVILSKALMSYHELTSIDYNSGDVYRSQGIDVGLHSVNFDNKNFGWSTDLNFSLYRNHTVERDVDWLPAIYQPTVEDWGSIYGYRTNGLIGAGQSYPYLPSSQPGAIHYLDVNGYKLDADGVTQMRDEEGRYIYSGQPDGKLDAADYAVLANATPIPFSINNTFRWKNWDANIYLYGSLNGYRINNVKYQSVWGISDLTYGINVLDELKNRWSPNNPEGTQPGVAEANSGIDPANSDFFYEKAWYLRLDNISVGYTFPARWFQNTLKNLRIYASARNVAVFTPYKGMDPETGNGIGAYPNQASFAFGVDIKF
ncbi:MAG: TonB-dependent receptor [Prevotellaceae bacterium]|jgi:TonB-linked SusC/RagA family outer membrane protein|nr:TonB-dependent receptor [Prevotellaceae bacterium]